MATTKNTRTNSRTSTTRASSTSRTTRKPPTRPTVSRTDTAQVKEGATKVRNGAVSIAVSGAERAVDVPAGAPFTRRQRGEDVIAPGTSDTRGGRELKTLRTQVTREFNK